MAEETPVPPSTRPTPAARQISETRPIFGTQSPPLGPAVRADAHSVVPTRKVSMEAQRQSVVTVMSFISLMLSGYYAVTTHGPVNVRIILAVVAGAWFFLLVHSVRAATEARHA